jgi:hypothetical protein
MELLKSSHREHIIAHKQNRRRQKLQQRGDQTRDGADIFMLDY